jgi:hypothetical protein
MAVAFLGEAQSANWWSSSFLTPNGLAFAEFNFPRATRFAAVSGATAGAKRFHDERIGRRQCVHLFRLSLIDEMLVQQALRSGEGALLAAMPLTRGDAMAVLEEEGREIISVEAGPVQIGNASDAFTEAGVIELAKHYAAAFRQDVKCLPYFASSKQ